MTSIENEREVGDSEHKTFAGSPARTARGLRVELGELLEDINESESVNGQRSTTSCDSKQSAVNEVNSSSPDNTSSHSSQEIRRKVKSLDEDELASLSIHVFQTLKEITQEQGGTPMSMTPSSKALKPIAKEEDDGGYHSSRQSSQHTTSGQPSQSQTPGAQTTSQSQSPGIRALTLEIPTAFNGLLPIATPNRGGDDDDANSSDSDDEMRELKTSRSMCSSTTQDGYEMINDYMVIDTIGEGRFGRVLLAINEDTKDPRAIKVLPKKAIRRRRGSNGHTPAGSPQTSMMRVLSAGSNLDSMDYGSPWASLTQDPNYQQLQREVAIMKKLRHKNVVSLYEVIDDPQEDSLYLVMQYAENGTLLKVEDGKCTALPEDAVKRYMSQLVAGMSYLAKHNIVHRDIKPDNILLSRNDEVLIADFGLSEVLEAESEVDALGIGSPMSNAASKLKGTPAFMAPEVLHGDATVGPEADVWALGVTLYCMLWGELPFNSPTWRGTVQMIVEKEVEFPEGADPVWVDLVEMMLMKDPSQRASLGALRRHPLLSSGRVRSPSTSSANGSLTPLSGSFVMHGSFSISPSDMEGAFTEKHDGSTFSGNLTSPTRGARSPLRVPITSGSETSLTVPKPLF